MNKDLSRHGFNPIISEYLSFNDLCHIIRDEKLSKFFHYIFKILKNKIIKEKIYYLIRVPGHIQNMNFYINHVISILPGLYIFDLIRVPEHIQNMESYINHVISILPGLEIYDLIRVPDHIQNMESYINHVISILHGLCMSDLIRVPKHIQDI